MASQRHPLPDLTYATLPALYDMTSVIDGWQSTLDKIAASVEAGQGAVVFGISGFDDIYAPDRASTFFKDRIELAPIWLEKFRHYEVEAEKTLLSLADDEIWTDNKTWPETELEGREDRVFLLEHFEARCRFAIPLRSDDGWRAGLLVHTREKNETVERSAAAVLNFLRPHLSASLGLRRFVSGLIAQYRAVLSVLDRIAVGLMVSDPSGHIVLVNETAQATMDRHGGLRLGRDRRLRAREDAITRQLDGAMREASRAARRLDAPVRDICLTPSSGTKNPLLVEVSPMRDGGNEFQTGFAGALITLIDPNAPPPIDVHALAAVHALTRAEMEVASLVLKGHTAPSIAEIRDVSPHTARTQIRAIYRKTGVDGRGGLALKAARLKPPVT